MYVWGAKSGVQQRLFCGIEQAIARPAHQPLKPGRSPERKPLKLYSVVKAAQASSLKHKLPLVPVLRHIRTNLLA